ncbi:MAG: glycosyltransferase family 2 protein [Bacteroidetes bacterium]|nr:glycosyltransferase family 2 protein [Bacteroidota bacterium]
MKVSIIIVNYRVPQLLNACLASIRNQVKVQYEVIVTDNASNDGSVEMIREKHPWVKLIASPVNTGFSAGNNLAMPFATGDYIFFLNPDTIVVKDSVDVLCQYLDSHPETGLVAPRLLNGDGSLQRSIRNFYSFSETLLDNRLFPFLFSGSAWFQKNSLTFWQHDSERSVDWAKGAALLVRKSILDKIGYFDEQFWIYGEEMDLCYRIIKEGWKIDFTPAAEIIHFEKQSSRQHNSVMFIQNYKSFYLFLLKHYLGYDFQLYRFRAVSIILAWFCFFKVKSWFSGNPDDQAESKKYKEVFTWHLNLKSNLKKPFIAPK